MNAFYPFAYAYGKVSTYKPDTTTSRSLDGVYVDGISITSGNPRKHVWTYAVGLSDDYNYPQYNCPCAKPLLGQIFLHLSSVTTIVSQVILEHLNVPLYTIVTHYGMEQVVYLKTVVAIMLVTRLPWFFRQFPVTTTGDIEVRICRDETFVDEGVAVKHLQLYVQ